MASLAILKRAHRPTVRFCARIPALLQQCNQCSPLSARAWPTPAQRSCCCRRDTCGSRSFRAAARLTERLGTCRIGEHRCRAYPLKVPLRLAHACGRARPPGSRPAGCAHGGAERCQAPCGTSRRLRRRADAANRPAGLRRDGFLCGLVSNDTFVRRRRLQRIAPAGVLLSESLSRLITTSASLRALFRGY